LPEIPKHLRLLVVRLGAMGDILHSMPAVTALRQAHPEWVIGWAIEPQWRGLFCANGCEPRTLSMPLVDQLHVVPAKQWAKSPLQPATLRDPAALAALAAWHPEALVVVAYGLILPPTVLALPRFGCLNIHASLLPRWRGAAPVQRAILAGDAQSGVTIMQMDAGLDTGPILLERARPIGAHDTSASLLAVLATLGADALLEALAGLLLSAGRGDVAEKLLREELKRAGPLPRLRYLLSRVMRESPPMMAPSPIRVNWW